MVIDPSLDIKLLNDLVGDEDKRRVLGVVTSKRLLQFQELLGTLAKEGVDRDRVEATVRELARLGLLDGFDDSELPEDYRSIFATARGFSAKRQLSKFRFPE